MTPETQKSALRESLETLGLNQDFEKKYKACNSRSDIDECQKQIKLQYKKLSLQNHPDKGGNPETFQKINQANEYLKSSYESAIVKDGTITLDYHFDRNNFSNQIRNLESKNFKGERLKQDLHSTTPRPDTAPSRPTQASSRPTQASSRPASANFSQNQSSHIFFIPGVGIFFFKSGLPSQKKFPSRNPEFNFETHNTSRQKNTESFPYKSDFKNYQQTYQKPIFHFNDEANFNSKGNSSFDSFSREKRNFLFSREKIMPTNSGKWSGR